jgi:histidinol-phosphatase (PHP family)
MHTRMCRHATGEPAQYAARAIAIGLTEIGFSDHSPMPTDGFDDWRMRLSELDEYVELVMRARKDFPAVRIALGLEIDFLPGHEDWIRDLAHRYDWDYLIGSVHYVEAGWDIDNPAKIGTWQDRNPAEVWAAYFDRLTEAAGSGLFDIIGHVDLCKKFGFVPETDFMPQVHKFLSTAAGANAAIEINTAGLRKQCREIYPSRPILDAAFKLNIPITFGSDAHAPDEVGADFSSAVALAKSCGYTHSLSFRQRRRELARL